MVLLLTRGKVEILIDLKCKVLCVKSQSEKGFAYAGDGVEFLVKKWLVYLVQIYIYQSLAI